MPTSDRRALHIYAMVVSAAIVVRVVAGPSYARPLYLGVVLCALVASWYGPRRRPDAARASWRWLQAGLALVVVGLLLVLVVPDRPDWQIGLRVLHLSSYGCIAAMTWSLGRVGTSLAAADRVLASVIAASAGAIVAFVFVSQPLWSSGAVTETAELLRAMFPVLSLAMAAVVLRQLSSASRMSPAQGYLAAGLVVFFLADLVGALGLVVTRWAGAQHTIQLVAFGLLGAAALHPAVGDRIDAPRSTEHPLSRTELAAVLLAGIGAPLSLALRVDATARPELFVLATGSAVLMALVLARLWRVLVALREVTRREGEQRFRALVENAGDVICVMAADGRMTYVSPTAESVWGYAPDELALAGFDMVVEGDREAVRETFDAVVERGSGASQRLEGRVTHGDGSTRWFEAVYANRLDDPAIGGIVVTSRDVTERHELEQRLWNQAYVDPLTGLPNRALLLRELDVALRNCEKEPCSALIVFGLDDLKTLNDSLGSHRGDELLRTTAERLRRGAVTGSTIARLGGDEFALLLPFVDDIDVATETARRGLDALARPVTLGGRLFEPQASCGVTIGRHGVSATELLRQAESAMHEAKREDRGGFRRFDPEMHRAAVRRLQLQMDLAAAIEREQLWVAYQPIHEIRTGRLIGVEALLRWDHPLRGPVPPDEFVPLAEACGRIGELGRFVLRRACRDLAELERDRGLALTLSVNLSPAQLDDPQLTETVAAALAESGLPAPRLTLEVTEGLFLDHSESVLAALESLRGLGTKLAIDDFGTGYCALGYLMTFRFDVVKIDRSFIQVLDDEERDHRVTFGILDLVAKLEVPAVAEGIETSAQLEELRAIGCEYGQGYHWSRPLPLGELALPSSPDEASDQLAGSGRPLLRPSTGTAG